MIPTDGITTSYIVSSPTLPWHFIFPTSCSASGGKAGRSTWTAAMQAVDWPRRWLLPRAIGWPQSAGRWARRWSQDNRRGWAWRDSEWHREGTKCRPESDKAVGWVRRNDCAKLPTRRWPGTGRQHKEQIDSKVAMRNDVRTAHVEHVEHEHHQCCHSSQTVEEDIMWFFFHSAWFNGCTRQTKIRNYLV